MHLNFHFTLTLNILYSNFNLFNIFIYFQLINVRTGAKHTNLNNKLSLYFKRSHFKNNIDLLVC